METKKRPRGRPKKKEGTIELWRFVRAAMVMSAYDEARAGGQKHGVAVEQAVDTVRRCDLGMSVSITEVRRTLADHRPRNSKKILRFERSARSIEDLEINHRIREHLAALEGKKGITLPEVPNYDLSKNRLLLTIRLGTRPLYPRHNRQIPKE